MILLWGSSHASSSKSLSLRAMFKILGTCRGRSPRAKLSFASPRYGRRKKTRSSCPGQSSGLTRLSEDSQSASLSGGVRMTIESAGANWGDPARARRRRERASTEAFLQG